MHSFRFYPTLLCAIGAAVVSVDGAFAQQTRIRTLTFDPQRQAWVESAPPLPGTPEAQLHDIRVAIKEKKYRRALAGAKRFIDEHGTYHPLHPEVLLARAEAWIGRKHYGKAHETLQEFLAGYSGIALTAEALRLEFIVAEAFLSGQRRRFWGIPLLSGEDVALRILDEIAAGYPESRLAELAARTKADYLFNRGEHGVAEFEYSRLLRDFPQSRYHQYALRRYADAALAAFGGVEYDEAALIEADERYRNYRARYPGDARREGINQVLETIAETHAAKHFAIGQYYERTGHISSAVFYYHNVREDWPDSIAAKKATVRLELLGALESAASDAGTSRSSDATAASGRRSNP